MKSKIILGLIILFMSNIGFSQAKFIKNNNTKDTLIENTKDYDAYIYKCHDDSTNKDVYVDFIEPGEVGFLINKTYVIYSINAYKLTATDSTWKFDSLTVYLNNTMPIDSIIINRDASKIFIYSKDKNGCSKISALNVLHPLSGLRENAYLRRKKNSVQFKYGVINTPSFLRYEK